MSDERPRSVGFEGRVLVHSTGDPQDCPFGAEMATSCSTALGPGCSTKCQAFEDDRPLSMTKGQLELML